MNEFNARYTSFNIREVQIVRCKRFTIFTFDQIIDNIFINISFRNVVSFRMSERETEMTFFFI